ncbi:MAG: hypothetical protein JWM11_2643 [Planctomycetaceae bacterium]|nr:hypothetical protein [Planctomycetaceae bacterium]
MLILDRTQRTWAVCSGVLLALGTAAFCWVHWTSPDGARGGSLSGLLFGIIAAAMMVYAGLLGARRRCPPWLNLGSGAFWMRSHLWIGTLTVPFSLFHAGFHWGGTFEILLWLLFIIVILSGFWGLAMQNVLPKLMLDNLPRETFLQQIPHLCAQFVMLADNLVTSKCGPLEFGSAPQRSGEIAAGTNAIATSKSRPAVISQAKVAVESAAPVEQKVISLKPVAAKADLPADAAVATTTKDPTRPNPGPKAMLEAARARKEAVAKEQTTAGTPASPVENVPTFGGDADVSTAKAIKPKADPKAMLEAARAKKEAAAKEQATAGTPEVPVENPPALGSAAEVRLPNAIKPKADPKAMLEAARARKEAATKEQATTAPPEVPVENPPALGSVAEVRLPNAIKPKADPKAMLEAARAKKEAAANAVPAAETPATSAVGGAADVGPRDTPKPKADPRAMLMAARAKKAESLESAAVGPVDPAPIPRQASAPAGETPSTTSIADRPVTVRTRPPEINPLVGTGEKGRKAGTGASADSVTEKPAAPNQHQKDELKQVYLELVRPYLAPQRVSNAWKESIRRAIMACRVRSAGQHPEFVPVFEELQDYCEQRQQFALVEWYHFWMQRWLIFHIPATVGLYVVLIVHIVMALRVIPFGN